MQRAAPRLIFLGGPETARRPVQLWAAACAASGRLAAVLWVDGEWHYAVIEPPQEVVGSLPPGEIEAGLTVLAISLALRIWAHLMEGRALLAQVSSELAVWGPTRRGTQSPALEALDTLMRDRAVAVPVRLGMRRCTDGAPRSRARLGARRAAPSCAAGENKATDPARGNCDRLEMLGARRHDPAPVS